MTWMTQNSMSCAKRFTVCADANHISLIHNQLQMYMPYWGALFTGVTMRILDAQILRRAASFSRIGVATAFGFYLGACGANRLHSNLWRSFDEDITNAFDERYVKRALNVSGLNSNWVNVKHNEDFMNHSRPF